MDREIWISALVGFLAPLVLFSPLNAAKAWVTSLLDANRAVTSAPASRQGAHPIVTLRGAPREAQAVAARGRPAKSSSAQHAQARPLTAKPLDPKEQLAKTIDPVRRPDWYLIDPTLKKGDVLFLRNRVVVFKGDRIGNLKDYVPVSRTRLLSKKERRIIEGLALRDGAPSAPSRPAPRGAATAEAGEPALRVN